LGKLLKQWWGIARSRGTPEKTQLEYMEFKGGDKGDENGRSGGFSARKSR